MTSTATPMERCALMMERCAVLIAGLMGMHEGVHLSHDSAGWRCTKVTPEVWFGAPFFDADTGLPRGPWTLDGQFIRLKTVDGEWVWRLTGETAELWNIEGPFTAHRAVWPD